MPRVKASAFRGRAKVYTPQTVKASDGSKKPHPAAVYKATVKQAWGENERLDGALSVTIDAVFPRPQNMFWKTKAMPTFPHTSKPDTDNIAKAVLDALNGLAYVDDSQVARLIVTKRVADGVEQPRTVVEVVRLGAMP